jgi:hypothetical protein
MPVEIVLEDISASGRVLLETVRYQIEMGVKRSSESRAHDLANFVDLGGISPDGQWLVYNDFSSGDYEALARKGDGAAAIRVGQGYGDSITWDGSLVPAPAIANRTSCTYIRRESASSARLISAICAPALAHLRTT